MLCNLLDLPDTDALASWQKEAVAAAIVEDNDAFRQRSGKWSESIAVGSHDYTAAVQHQPGISGIHRKAEDVETDGVWVLREEETPYRRNSERENSSLSQENAS